VFYLFGEYGLNTKPNLEISGTKTNVWFVHRNHGRYTSKRLNHSCTGVTPQVFLCNLVKSVRGKLFKEPQSGFKMLTAFLSGINLFVLF